MARALITGVAGFAGGWLAEHLLLEGDVVVGLALDAAQAARSLAASGLEGRIEEVLEADLLDGAALARAIDRARPDRVYHLAGFSSPGLSLADPLGAFRANALGTAMLLEAIRLSGARPRTLVVGSGECYGAAAPALGRISEETPQRPRTPYGASKVAAEALAVAAFHAHGLPVVAARAFNHTGPRQEAVFAAPSFARQVARAEAGLEPPEIRVGNLSPVRDLSDVRDVVRAYRLLAERGRPGETYNVCSGRGASMAEVLDILVARARRPLAVVVDEARVRAVDTARLVGDPSKLAAETGYAPRHELAETLAYLLDHWRGRAAAGAA